MSDPLAVALADREIACILARNVPTTHYADAVIEIACALDAARESGIRAALAPVPQNAIEAARIIDRQARISGIPEVDPAWTCARTLLALPAAAKETP